MSYQQIYVDPNTKMGQLMQQMNAAEAKQIANENQSIINQIDSVMLKTRPESKGTTLTGKLEILCNIMVHLWRSQKGWYYVTTTGQNPSTNHLVKQRKLLSTNR